MEPSKRKEGSKIEYNPVIDYITSMLRRMRPETVRAVYMVVQELDRINDHRNSVS